VPWWRLRWPGPCAPSDAARARIDQLLAAPLSIDGATELALLNHRGLQAALAELGIAQAEAVQAARWPNPGFTLSRTRSGGEVEWERCLHVGLGRLLLMPLAREDAERAERLLGLTRGSRFFNALEVGATRSSNSEGGRSRGWEIGLELPILDPGSALLTRPGPLSAPANLALTPPTDSPRTFAMPTTHPHPLPRRALLRQLTALASAGIAGGLPSIAAAAAPPLTLEIWKAEGCGCCKDWMAHLEREFGAGTLRMDVHDQGNAAARKMLGLPDRYGSCHTARLSGPGLPARGYVLEGHVPAREIRRLLKERPDALGLTVPAMPVGSPGMDGPEYGGRRDPYDVLLVARDGSARVYQAYR
jgi:hypothetical protein